MLFKMPLRSLRSLRGIINFGLKINRIKVMFLTTFDFSNTKEGKNCHVSVTSTSPTASRNFKISSSPHSSSSISVRTPKLLKMLFVSQYTEALFHLSEVVNSVSRLLVKKFESVFDCSLSFGKNCMDCHFSNCSICLLITGWSRISGKRRLFSFLIATRRKVSPRLKK